VIDAYLDESGIHSGAAVCVIAGYFGGPGQFKKFDRAWRRELKAMDIEMEDFHAKDLTRSRDQRRIKSLAYLISEFKISPISFGVVVRDFYSFTETQRKFLTGATLEETGRVKQAGSPDKPYFMPFQHIVRRLASYAPVGGKVNFHFGLDRTFAGIARATFENVQSFPNSNFRDRLGKTSFPLASNTSALQAADLLVHLTYDHMLRQEKTKNAYLERGLALRMLLDRSRVAEDYIYYNRDCIQKHLNQIPLEHRGDTLTEF
jgi:hypothetical protein